MNWLFRISQSMALPSDAKSMALPSAKLPDDLTQGVDAIDSYMNEESAEWFDKTFPDAKGLGSGQYGVVYECVPGKACKITHEYDEIKIARYLMKHPNLGFVRVYGVKQIQHGNRSDINLWLLIMEKVSTLDAIDRKIWDFMYFQMDQDVAVWARLVSNIMGKDYEEMFERVTWLHDRIEQMLRFCYQDGIIAGDVSNVNNVGYTDDGRLVILDLGRVSPPMPEIEGYPGEE